MTDPTSTASASPRSTQKRPMPSTELLATIRRSETEELRVCLIRPREGEPFVTIRVWASGGRGFLQETEKGLRVSASELVPLAATALDGFKRLLD